MSVDFTADFDREALNRLRAEAHEQDDGDPARYFYACPTCCQTVDKRRLGDVFHHAFPKHPPIPAND